MRIYGGEEDIGGLGSGIGGLSDCSQLLDDCCTWCDAAMWSWQR